MFRWCAPCHVYLKYSEMDRLCLTSCLGYRSIGVYKTQTIYPGPEGRVPA